jgi:hypothetical protein
MENQKSERRDERSEILKIIKATIKSSEKWGTAGE